MILSNWSCKPNIVKLNKFWTTIFQLRANSQSKREFCLQNLNVASLNQTIFWKWKQILSYEIIFDLSNFAFISTFVSVVFKKHLIDTHWSLSFFPWICNFHCHIFSLIGISAISTSVKTCACCNSDLKNDFWLFFYVLLCSREPNLA